MGRRLRRALTGRRPPASFGSPLVHLKTASQRTEGLLRAAYCFFPFWFSSHVERLRPLVDPPVLDLLWPVRWLSLVGPDKGAPIVLAFGVLSSLFGALAPDRRAVRILVFLGLLEVLALQYSFGKIHHQMHGWLYVSFIFAVFLPDAAFRADRASRAEKQHALLAFQAAQVMVGLTYSLAGIGKLLGSVYQAALGQLTPLHPMALAYLIADRLLQTFPESVLGPFMITYGHLLWPLMLGTLYLQLFCVVAAFRPSLHRLWGFGLIGFHLVTALSMTIDFSPNVLLVGLLFGASPSAPRSFDIRAILRDLPVFGGLLERLSFLRRPQRA